LWCIQIFPWSLAISAKMAWHFSMCCSYKLEEEKDEEKLISAFPWKELWWYIMLHFNSFKHRKHPWSHR
jgi:hypothetical protein